MSAEILDRYLDLLGPGPFEWVGVAMSWTVVQPLTSAPAELDQIVRQLGGDPAGLRERGLDQAYEKDDDRCRWYVEPDDGSVALMEVNNFQAARPPVLRRLSIGATVHSAYWNVNNNTAFSYARGGVLLTAFDGFDPDYRVGDEPDALEGDRVALWRLADEEHRREAMLALIEVRTGMALDDEWLARPHLSFLADSMPEDP